MIAQIVVAKTLVAECDDHHLVFAEEAGIDVVVVVDKLVGAWPGLPVVESPLELLSFLGLELLSAPPRGWEM